MRTLIKAIIALLGLLLVVGLITLFSPLIFKGPDLKCLDDGLTLIRSEERDMHQTMVNESAKLRKSIDDAVTTMGTLAATVQGRISNSIDRSAGAFGNGLGAVSEGIKATNEEVKTIGTSIAEHKDATEKGFQALEKEIADLKSAFAQKPADPPTPAPVAAPSDPKPAEVKTAPPPAPADSEGELRTIGVGKATDRGRYLVYEYSPGDISERFCVDDIKAGKVKISHGDGITAMVDYGFGKPVVPVSVPPDGNLTLPESMKSVRFVSETSKFTVWKKR